MISDSERLLAYVAIVKTAHCSQNKVNFFACSIVVSEGKPPSGKVEHVLALKVFCFNRESGDGDRVKGLGDNIDNKSRCFFSICYRQLLDSQLFWNISAYHIRF